MKCDENTTYTSPQPIEVHGNNHHPLQPKHIQFPDVPNNSELVNELIIFIYSVIVK